MSFKKPSDERHYDSSGKKVRVRNSYYTFSKEYPAGNIGVSGKAAKLRNKKKNAFRIFISVVSLVLLLTVSFFLTDTAIKFSYKPDTQASEIQSNQNGDSVNLLENDSVKAIYMDWNKLSDRKYIKSVIKKVNRRDCNSVVIDFKTRDGHLAFSSAQQTALVSKCDVFDNETVRHAIKHFNSAGVTVIAGIYCFEDALVSSSISDFAVKYLNTDVNWLDNLEENGGKTWLNPYNKEVGLYIKSIVSEVYNLGARGFILKSVCFPDSESISSATFPGEKKKTLRNKLLDNFVSSIKSTLPKDAFLLVDETARDVLSGNETLYAGSFSRNSADGVVADTSIRPEQYFPDKKSHFSSMLGMFAEIKTKLNENAKLVLFVSEDEYSRKYIKTIRRSGFENYIMPY